MRKAAFAAIGLCLLVFFSGCANHEADIRQRAQQLIGYLCADDMDGCVSLTDPLYVRAQGSQKVKFAFKIFNLVIRIGKLGPEDVRIDQVVLGEGNKTAEVHMSARKGEDWQPLEPSNWVRVDNQWYISF
ncbi:MAG: hypothetical protein H8E44_27665 [Planctomycetes bacterium]|nr:hypothetical protein [Planctomycetota bacterium]MBL7040835.1 hypothetical protein [Pirellulaceae bacterium]